MVVFARVVGLLCAFEYLRRQVLGKSGFCVPRLLVLPPEIRSDQSDGEMHMAHHAVFMYNRCFFVDHGRKRGEALHSERYLATLTLSSPTYERVLSFTLTNCTTANHRETRGREPSLAQRHGRFLLSITSIP
ncbi:hypothetical protein F4808DRAFT_422150 [Astrocystis sublimbata]|nr:hypothetical protein F4808DRAFT_422150 [Astrocystis sublimbata]